MIIDITCPNCNFTKQVSREKIPEGIKFAKCPRCNKTFALPSMDNQDTAPPETDKADNGSDTAPPVCDPVIIDEPDYFTGLWRTFKGVLFSPTEFFREMSPKKGFRDAMAFGILLGSIGAMFGLFWQFLMQSQDILYIAKLLPESVSVNGFFLALIIVSPLLVLINVVIVSLVLHVSLFILRGASNGLEATFKVVLYSNAVSVFSLIPYLGSLITFIWSAVIIVTGLREIHRTSTMKAVFALLLPLFAIVIFMLAIVAIVYFASLVI